MRHSEVEGLSPGAFKRLTGVRRETFGRTLEVLQQSERQKKRSGSLSKLSSADELLPTLMCRREYRTQFHIAKSYGVHEANANRIIHKVEGTLAASGAFRLPGKRAARSADGAELSFVVIDATETPVERPQKKQRACPHLGSPSRRAGHRQKGLWRPQRALPRTA